MPTENVSTDEPEWVEAWKEHVSAFDRVTSVTLTLSRSRSASWIGEEAAVSSNTARDHLRRLIDLGIVMGTEQNGTHQYYPDPLYTRLRDVRELLEDTTKRELSEQASALKEDISEWKVEYDADSPDALRERTVAEDVPAEQAQELTRIASDWELARYRLSLVRDAIENYDRWTSDPSSFTI